MCSPYSVKPEIEENLSCSLPSMHITMDSNWQYSIPAKDKTSEKMKDKTLVCGKIAATIALITRNMNKLLTNNT